MAIRGGVGSIGEQERQHMAFALRGAMLLALAITSAAHAQSGAAPGDSTIVVTGKPLSTEDQAREVIQRAARTVDTPDTAAGGTSHHE